MRFIVYLFISLIFFSCSSETAEDAASAAADSLPVKDESFSRGIAIPKINCKADSAINYALYLPEKYSVSKKSPIIFFFDSHGSGLLPVEKYKGLAEKYGYILAGSNNSKNGMNWDQNRAQIQIFMNDVKERLNVDLRRVYTCGFSGGSRVASSVAIFVGGIAGVIGMGAGFPSLSEPINNRFDYIGFAGNEDFNMNEMIQLSASMDKSPIRHQLIVFNGKHEWAPDSIAENAFVWMEFNGMKDGIITKNDSAINSFISRSEKEIQKQTKEKNVYNEFITCVKTANFLDQLIPDSSYKVKANALYKSEKMKNALAKKEKLANEEMSFQQSLSQNLIMKDEKWWMKELGRMNAVIIKNADPERVLMNKRLKAYLGLAAYMQSMSALAGKQIPMAEKILAIYSDLEPSNPESSYLHAVLFMQKEKHPAAITCLRTSVHLGFSDLDRLQADTSFFQINNTPDFLSIIEHIKTNDRSFKKY